MTTSRPRARANGRAEVAPVGRSSTRQDPAAANVKQRHGSTSDLKPQVKPAASDVTASAPAIAPMGESSRAAAGQTGIPPADPPATLRLRLAVYLASAVATALLLGFAWAGLLATPVAEEPRLPASLQQLLGPGQTGPGPLLQKVTTAARSVLGPSAIDPCSCAMTYSRPSYPRLNLATMPIPYGQRQGKKVPPHPGRGVLFAERTEADWAAAYREASRSGRYQLIRFDDAGRPPATHLPLQPVLFIAGSGGSSKQVRSLASVAARHAHGLTLGYKDPEMWDQFDEWDLADLGGSPTASLVFYSVETDGEMTGFRTDDIMAQAHFANYVLAWLANHHPTADSIILIGHSMGGIVARTMPLLASHPPRTVQSYVTLATPHASPPLPAISRTLHDLYQAVNYLWAAALATQEAGSTAAMVADSQVADTAAALGLTPVTDSAWFRQHVSLLSLAPGSRDLLVDGSLNWLQGLLQRGVWVDWTDAENTPGGRAVLSPATNVVSGWTTGLPGVSTSQDHQTIVWCAETVRAVNHIIQAQLHANDGRAAMLDLPRRVAITRQIVSPSFSQRFALPQGLKLGAEDRRLTLPTVPAVSLDAGRPCADTEVLVDLDRPLVIAISGPGAPDARSEPLSRVDVFADPLSAPAAGGWPSDPFAVWLCSQDDYRDLVSGGGDSPRVPLTALTAGGACTPVPAAHLSVTQLTRRQVSLSVTVDWHAVIYHGRPYDAVAILVPASGGAARWSTRTCLSAPAADRSVTSPKSMSFQLLLARRQVSLPLVGHTVVLPVPVVGITIPLPAGSLASELVQLPAWTGLSALGGGLPLRACLLRQGTTSEGGPGGQRVLLWTRAPANDEEKVHEQEALECGNGGAAIFSHSHAGAIREPSSALDFATLADFGLHLRLLRVFEQEETNEARSPVFGSGGEPLALRVYWDLRTFSAHATRIDAATVAPVLVLGWGILFMVLGSKPSPAGADHPIEVFIGRHAWPLVGAMAILSAAAAAVSAVRLITPADGLESLLSISAGEAHALFGIAVEALAVAAYRLTASLLLAHACLGAFRLVVGALAAILSPFWLLVVRPLRPVVRGLGARLPGVGDALRLAAVISVASLLPGHLAVVLLSIARLLGLGLGRLSVIGMGPTSHARRTHQYKVYLLFACLIPVALAATRAFAWLRAERLIDWPFSPEYRPTAHQLADLCPSPEHLAKLSAALPGAMAIPAGSLKTLAQAVMGAGAEGDALAVVRAMHVAAVRTLRLVVALVAGHLRLAGCQLDEPIIRGVVSQAAAAAAAAAATATGMGLPLAKSPAVVAHAADRLLAALRVERSPVLVMAYGLLWLAAERMGRALFPDAEPSTHGDPGLSPADKALVAETRQQVAMALRALCLVGSFSLLAGAVGVLGPAMAREIASYAPALFLSLMPLATFLASGMVA
ncbi:hypothetical protein H696_00099 [Fonticula alba]|uniref:GPI inositol-deacylase n=1 Tax=Fonticula alba TaxID=691883 RepID=A0A058ZDR8_FONAL|nr:hypothetical protein H696_00099 [Fonticula alba]KCV72504.1 hypothetical protein H696_00099 [Fonticula alba]|eukprot:XP_009492205.1 hypothetical protein H696_00099 [Fonticula alba]